MGRRERIIYQRHWLSVIIHVHVVRLPQWRVKGYCRRTTALMEFID